MPIFEPEPIIQRGKQDAKRHREKQKEVIKRNLKDIISEESIITGKRDKIIKIPIKGIDIPNFRRGKGSGGGGFGTGEGKPGDIIRRRKLDPGGKGAPGSEPGVDYLETEVDLMELIELMMEDFGLPLLEEKEVKQTIIELGYKITGKSKFGPWVNLDRRASQKEGFRTFYFMLRALEAETKRSELDCFVALKRANGILSDAIKLLEDPAFKVLDDDVFDPFPIFRNEDLRFRKIKRDTKEQSSAVVIAMLDVSGSMSTDKKYIARSMLFWLVEFLRKIYELVEIRFIIHHTEAKIVDEETCFKIGEGGGTKVHSAYDKAHDLIKDNYPTSIWNIYAWHFSDGDDFMPDKTIESLQKLFDLDINMFGYAEIRPEGSDNESTLRAAFKKNCRLVA